MDSGTPTEKDGVYIENTNPLSRQAAHRPRDVHGWGADLDPAQRPAVPKERTPPRLPDLAWDKPEAQVAHVRVLHSNERPGLTPVFGSTVPPSGISGAMREFAFRYSENDIRHWMILLGADRVNVVEGLASDLASGHVPNIFAEMGAAAEWKYNRAGFVRKALAVSATLALTAYLMRRKGRYR